MGDILGINGFFRALPSEYRALATRTRQRRRSAAVSDPRAADTALLDVIELSARGIRLSRPTDAHGVHSKTRTDRIRTAIADGTYETPAKIGLVVGRLIDELRS